MPESFKVSSLAVPSYSAQDSTSQASSQSQKHILKVTEHEVTPAAVTLMPPSTANIQSQVVVPRSLFDLSHASSHPFSTVETPSSNHGPPSSPSKIVYVHPTPPQETSLNVPSPYSSPSQPPSGFMQDDSLSDALDDLLTIPDPIRSRSPKRPPGLRVKSDSTSLEVTLAPTSLAAHSIPQQRFDVAPINLVSFLFEITSTPAPVLPARPSSKKQVPSFVTVAALVSALIHIVSIISAYARKFLSNNEDFGTDQNGTLDSGNSVMHRLAQQTARHARFVFDPGGFTFTRTLTNTS